MDLHTRIRRIIYNEGLSLSEFYERSGISSKVYYAIKNGNKTKLKPSQAGRINKAFPKYSIEWLLGKAQEVIEYSINSGTIQEIANAGKLGNILNEAHNKLLKLDQSYAIWYEKESYAKAINLIKDFINER